MATHEAMVEQFRNGEFVDTRGGVGFIALKHVQSLGHVEQEGQHVAYVMTVFPHLLRVPPFETAQEAQDFIQRCADVFRQRRQAPA